MIVKNIATFFLGMLGANGSFVKVQNTLQPMGETDENMHVEKMQLKKSNDIAISLSRDSLETNGENWECSHFMKWAGSK